MTEVKKEPTVSVHGVPQSQFEHDNLPGSGSGGQPAPGSGKKWILWIGLGVVGLIVVFMLFGGGGQQTPDTTGGSGHGTDSAAVDAELQKLQSEIDQLLAGQKKKQPPPKKKKKKKKDKDNDIPGEALHHLLDTHGFADHQQLGV